jgi:hypothetical protein
MTAFHKATPQFGMMEHVNDFQVRGVTEVPPGSRQLNCPHYNNGGVGIGYCGGPPHITSTPVTIAQVDQLYTRCERYKRPGLQLP